MSIFHFLNDLADSAGMDAVELRIAGRSKIVPVYAVELNQDGSFLISGEAEKLRIGTARRGSNSNPFIPFPLADSGTFIFVDERKRSASLALAEKYKDLMLPQAYEAIVNFFSVDRSVEFSRFETVKKVADKAKLWYAFKFDGKYLVSNPGVLERWSVCESEFRGPDSVSGCQGSYVDKINLQPDRSRMSANRENWVYGLDSEKGMSVNGINLRRVRASLITEDTAAKIAFSESSVLSASRKYLDGIEFVACKRSGFDDGCNALNWLVVPSEGEQGTQSKEQFASRIASFEPYSIIISQPTKGRMRTLMYEEITSACLLNQIESIYDSCSVIESFSAQMKNHLGKWSVNKIVSFWRAVVEGRLKQYLGENAVSVNSKHKFHGLTKAQVGNLIMDRAGSDASYAFGCFAYLVNELKQHPDVGDKIHQTTNIFSPPFTNEKMSRMFDVFSRITNKWHDFCRSRKPVKDGGLVKMQLGIADNLFGFIQDDFKVNSMSFVAGKLDQSKYLYLPRDKDSQEVA